MNYPDEANPASPTGQSSDDEIARRKWEHLSIASRFSDLASRAGFERYRLPYTCLPEIDLGDVDPSATLFGRDCSMPLLVSASTGGTPGTFRILSILAESAQEAKVAICVGSQRIAIEDDTRTQYFRIRPLAPDVPILANLGAVQLNYGFGYDHCARAVEMVEADALVLHLNPLQECLQPEGNTDFSNLLSRIDEVCRRLSVPVVAKEVGFGIDPRSAQRLLDVGVHGIDLAGSGGTNWARIEGERREQSERPFAHTFASWGFPTTDLLACYLDEEIDPPLLIASGGLRSGSDIAVSIALGADWTGIGLPLIAAACTGAEATVALLARYDRELRTAMFCCGTSDVAALRASRVGVVDDSRSD